MVIMMADRTSINQTPLIYVSAIKYTLCRQYGQTIIFSINGNETLGSHNHIKCMYFGIVDALTDSWIFYVFYTAYFEFKECSYFSQMLAIYRCECTSLPQLSTFRSFFISRFEREIATWKHCFFFLTARN